MQAKLRSKVSKFLAILMLIVCTLQPVYAHDESELESLKEQQEEIQQQQTLTGEKLEAAQQKVDEMDAALRELDAKIGEAESAIQELDVAIEDNLKLLDETKEELVQAEAEEEIWYEKLKLRIKAMYESGDINYLEVLLQAGSMSELLSKAEYTKELAEYDQEIMENLRESRKLVEEKQKEIEEEEAILEQNRAEEQVKKEELQAAKEEKDAEMKELQSDADALALYQQKLEQEKDDLIAEITALEQELEAKRKAEEEAKRKAEEEAKRKAEEEAKRQEQQNQNSSSSSQVSNDSGNSGSSNVASGSVSSSGMVWPVPGYSYLSTYFGTYGHRGIDIPAPSGTPILASAGGTVITATYNSSYGNYVAISHGNGMVTVYAHASALCVSVGDYVSAGQTVALVGTTGYSTGNHLHFEVQISGGLYNPLNYVSP